MFSVVCGPGRLLLLLIPGRLGGATAYYKWTTDCFITPVECIQSNKVCSYSVLPQNILHRKKCHLASTALCKSMYRMVALDSVNLLRTKL